MSEMNISQRLRLYLIRHGEIEPAAMGKLIGRTDVALSERGIEQTGPLHILERKSRRTGRHTHR
jgi:broad specificity phosphatase PhoE